MRRPVWFRVKLGDFYLQEHGGWGSEELSAVYTREKADAMVEWLKMRGTNACVTPV
jgi:hypothetical protein